MKLNKTRRPHNAEEEEQCEDKVCSDTKSNMRSWFNAKTSSTGHECPLDKQTLGRTTWSLLHTMAGAYPLNPTQNDKTNMEEFIRLISVLYPCSYCAKDFREDIKEIPPKLDSRPNLSNWFCQIHNKVNVKLGKPQFDCSKVDERWRTGPKDGSCY